ncbi:MAG: flagellar assembly protein FliH [Alcaligenaceae bacterium]|nr:flagellar assembly protein FliH [Alcaligenaceae bacterium SAGV5]MPS52051.1 flagellar assembly protein FliH [Alcaligenaceae bacterium SAGV3]MPT57452.1 flagellar assembly protein FliH [Alcaligenaceae bacterium]
MSEPLPGARRILRADEGRHLPVWRLDTFGDPSMQDEARRRPQTPEEQRAIEAALLAARQEAERRPHGEAIRRETAAPDSAAAGTAPPPPAPVPTVDPAEAERIKTAAFDEGYAAGYDHGSAAARREAEQLRTMARAASGVFDRFETELAPRLLELAIELARQVVRRELAQDNNMILAVVRDAFNQLIGGETGRQLLLHPSDVQLVRAHLGEELELGQWKIVEDTGIEAGGCRIATQQSDIDATLATRWKRTLAALGQDGPWSDDRA